MAVGDISGGVECGVGRLRLPLIALPLLSCALWLAACAGGAGDAARGEDAAHDRLVGAWRAEFTPADSHAPFTLRVLPLGGELSAVIERSGEETSVSSIVRRDLVVTIRLDQAETEIFAKMAPNGDSMSGFWRQQLEGAVSELPFKAWRMGPEEGG